MITKEEVIQLSKIHQPFCVSIFIPTHRAGEETLNGKDALKLKNQLKEVRQKLSEKEMSKNEIENFLTPITDLLENKEFWRHQSDGLAIFLSEDYFKTFSLPVYFEEFNYLSGEFYLKPLMPLFNGNHRFYLLSIKKDRVDFYEGSKHGITEIEISDLVPQQLEDVVGYDYEEKSLQHRSQQGNNGEGIFHGQNKANAKSKNEILRYFKAINNGIMELLHPTEKPPLVVCCTDHHFAIYKEVNTYKNLFPKNISTNPADTDPILLHEKAWQLLQPYFNKTLEEKTAYFSEALSNGKASSDIRKVIPQVIEGKVDTLFLENRADIFGVYNPSTNELKLHEEHKTANTSLLNLLTIKTFEQGGKVYLLEKDQMPDSTSKVNAIYRY